ncbi:hypothetical protein Tco_0998705, partial [Tanacetum coccineum]
GKSWFTSDYALDVVDEKGNVISKRLSLDAGSGGKNEENVSVGIDMVAWDDSSLIKGVFDGVFGELDNFDVFIGKCGGVAPKLNLLEFILVVFLIAILNGEFDEDIFLLVNEVEDEENLNDNEDDLGHFMVEMMHANV